MGMGLSGLLPDKVLKAGEGVASGEGGEIFRQNCKFSLLKVVTSACSWGGVIEGL